MRKEKWKIFGPCFLELHKLVIEISIVSRDKAVHRDFGIEQRLDWYFTCAEEKLLYSSCIELCDIFKLGWDNHLP